jgi:hypothetical protein
VRKTSAENVDVTVRNGPRGDAMVDRDKDVHRDID